MSGFIFSLETATRVWALNIIPPISETPKFNKSISRSSFC